MCLRHCFEEGSCARTKEGEFRLSGDGLRLYHRSPGKTEWRSYFKGDSDWTRNSDGTFAIVEHHNIELLGLVVGLEGGTFDAYQVMVDARKRLHNPHIYSALVKERLKALVRRGWAEPIYVSRYRLTRKGVEAAASALAKRHKF